jgi:hypothetical protein
MLLPPTSPTLILSDGGTGAQAFDMASSDNTEPAANTVDVFMKFLRVEVMVFELFLKEPKGNIKIASPLKSIIKKY